MIGPAAESRRQDMAAYQPRSCAHVPRPCGQDAGTYLRYRSKKNAYAQSLALEPNDGLTHDYLGYALFRLGRYAEAVQEFQTAIVQRPDYKWPPINLIKVDCIQQKFAEARQKLDVVRGTTALWKSDEEFMRLCAPILKP